MTGTTLIESRTERTLLQRHDQICWLTVATEALSGIVSENLSSRVNHDTEEIGNAIMAVQWALGCELACITEALSEEE